MLLSSELRLFCKPRGCPRYLHAVLYFYLSEHSQSTLFIFLAKHASLQKATCMFSNGHWRRQCSPLQYRCLGMSQSQRSLAGYGPCGLKSRVRRRLNHQHPRLPPVSTLTAGLRQSDIRSAQSTVFRTADSPKLGSPSTVASQLPSGTVLVLKTGTGAASGHPRPRRPPCSVHSAAAHLLPPLHFLGGLSCQARGRTPGLWGCLLWMFSPDDIDVLHVWQEWYGSGMPLDILYPQETQLKGARL